jgi:hypothetical protein
VHCARIDRLGREEELDGSSDVLGQFCSGLFSEKKSLTRRGLREMREGTGRRRCRGIGAARVDGIDDEVVIKRGRSSDGRPISRLATWLQWMFCPTMKTTQ